MSPEPRPDVYALNREIRAVSDELMRLDQELGLEPWQEGPLKRRRDAVKVELDRLLALHAEIPAWMVR